VHDLTRMAEEAFAVPERPIRCVVQGDPGAVPAAVATPLAVVLNELLQNTADHAFPAGQGGGKVVLSLGHEANELVLHVTDDGAGLPEGFDIESSAGLGLSIVRTLVRSELGGSIELRPAPGSGAQATIRVPV
jgi:two-component system, sensor histidine kinase PdtaS